jgi:hypothetical protein
VLVEETEGLLVEELDDDFEVEDEELDVEVLEIELGLELEELVEVVPQSDIVEYDVAHRVRYIVVCKPMSPIVVVHDVAVAIQELLLTKIGGVVEIEGDDVVGEELVEEMLEELGDGVGTELLDKEDELELVGGGSIEEVEELELLGLELDEVVVVVLDELEEEVVMIQRGWVTVVVKQVATSPLSSSSVVQPA